MYNTIEIQPPNTLKLKHNYTSIFLGGSIEMGKAEEWQKKIITSVQDKPYIFFNPRRDDWNSNWKQVKSDPQFSGQVKWELEALEIADYIIMYLDPNTVSPVSLIEFGLHARSGKLIMVCPDGYFKKGNIDITCEFYKVKQVNSIDELILMLNNDELRKR